MSSTPTKCSALLSLACILGSGVSPATGFLPRPHGLLSCGKQITQVNPANPRGGGYPTTWHTIMSASEQGDGSGKWQGLGPGQGQGSSDNAIPQAGGGASEAEAQEVQSGAKTPGIAGTGEKFTVPDEGIGLGVNVGDDDEVEMPSLDVPMMSTEEREFLWARVMKAEREAEQMEEAGDTDKASELRMKAKKLRSEDPYISLEELVKEAEKNEELGKALRLRLQMYQVGVPPHPDMLEEKRRDPESKKSTRSGKTKKRSSKKSSEGGKEGTDDYSSASVTITNGIKVEVQSQYHAEESKPVKDEYMFIYRIKVTNLSPQIVQLVSREWEIKSINQREKPQVVKGPGVIGQQPVLEPGQSFEYSSFCPIACAPKKGYQVIGRMQGSYMMVTGAVGEIAFEAKIDPFYLQLPKSVVDEHFGRGGDEGMIGGW